MGGAAVDLKRILLVDPDQRTREGVAVRLEFLDLEVLQAADAAEALRLFESGNPHLVVTDWPLLGGEEASLFHGRLKRGSVPVVFCSSEPGGKAEVEIPVAGRHVFVPKLDRKEVLSQVSKLLSEAADHPLMGREGNRGGVKSPRQILVIEDSPTLRGVIRRALEKGFPGDIIREAGEGREALSQMSQKKVDLIITDLEMPGMDGRMFLGHLKSSPLLSKKPVLIFSGNITAELEWEAAQLPRVRLLKKPATSEKIIQEAGILMGY